MSKQPIATREVAAMYGVSPDTVKRWADEDKLPHFKTPSGHRRFDPDVIQALIDSATTRSEPAA